MPVPASMDPEIASEVAVEVERICQQMASHLGEGSEIGDEWSFE